MERRGQGFQNRQGMGRGDEDCPVSGLGTRLDVQHRILRDVFVQDADLVDAVHEAPQLCNRRPGKPTRFVKRFEPLLYFKRLEVLRDSLTESFDEVVADVVLNDGYGVCRFRAYGVRTEIGLQVMLCKKME